MKILFALLLTCCVSLAGTAQAPLQFKLRHNVPVSTAAGALAMPWSGGLNTPQFSSIDLNKDGQEDLFIFDRMQRKVFTYLAVQENGQWRYQYAPAYEAFFPEGLEQWVLLRDYNCDGLKDIFTSSPLGIRVFRQEAAAQGQLKFTMSEDALYYRRNGREINMQMQAIDIPGIVDMDGDGDLDVLLTEFSSGYTMEYYQNMRVEQNLDCNSLTFVQATHWWGQVSECDGCGKFAFNQEQCSELEGGRLLAPMHSGHDGSSLLPIDLDGDGDKDLLMGSVMCANLMKLENIGSAMEALIGSSENSFPANTRAASFNLFPAAYYEDVTFDGVPDLLVAPNSYENEGNVELQQSVWLYKNNGAEHLPDFEYVQDDFLQGQMLDLGEGAFPAFADLDGDGKLDMLLGNHASIREGKYTASLSYYRNTGSSTAPAFTLVTDDYLQLAQQELLAIKPAFADFDGDGVQDLVLTTTRKQDGRTTISYIKNVGGLNNAFQLNTSAMQLLLTVEAGDAPAFADIDEDGDLDILLGKSNGRLSLFRNTGNAASVNFVLENASFGGIDFDFLKRNLYPTVADMDGNGRLDLLTVDDSGVVNFYKDFTRDLQTELVPATALLENEITKEVGATRFGKQLSISVASLGGKDKLYAVVGTQGGGLYLLEQTAGYTASPGESTESLALEVYPNPSGKGQRDVFLRAAVPVAFAVYDAVGRKVLGSEVVRTIHNMSNLTLQAGMYFVRATSRDGHQETKKLLVQ
ncbi:T9SS type A sorting domain-containing protein [Pontibacter harenae]|uniref:T9SS type A sorting domain-containing protein n=1 Tax=Pontibacter harenae TaxID=2894083 RepID=UPI001E537DC0|nr:T9SS type A sorting domain-containing protein [Pontibacter harenae]MCC9168787.1 T9SS type A sorting domain-containing protein [Pontibacter harenae]